MIPKWQKGLSENARKISRIVHGAMPIMTPGIDSNYGRIDMLEAEMMRHIYLTRFAPDKASDRSCGGS